MGFMLGPQVERVGQGKSRVYFLIILFLMLLLDTACNKNQRNKAQTSASSLS